MGGAMAFCALVLVISLPSTLRFVFSASSGIAGLLVACAFVIGAGMIGFYRISGGYYWLATLTGMIVTTFLVTVQGTIASLFVDGDMMREASSLAAFLVVLLTAYLVRNVFLQTRSASLDRVVQIISFGFVAVAVLAIADVQPVSSDYVKPVFPFAEPSHFALAFTPFLVYQCVRSSLPLRILWLIVALVLALLLESLSLVVAVGVAAACCLPSILFVVGIAAASAAASYLDISYYTDRLDFSIGTTNISTLVYIQGFELTGAALQRTAGWGIGFQQLGVVPLNVPTSDLIYRLIRDDANLYDGGFTAAKLIAELGLVGIAVLVAYVYFAVRAGLALRRLSTSGGAGSAQQLFALAAIVAPMIEFFVRGVGYFSGTLMLMITGLLIAMQERHFARQPVITA
jgi:hypothetical protein